MSDDVLGRGLSAMGLQLPEDALTLLRQYASLLEKWNRVYNLTAIREPEKIMTHHLLDSLVVLPHLPAGALADIGSGGGLPGIPIAIAQRGRSVALVEPNAKKAAFLRQAAIELSLANIRVHESRAEDLHPASAFDVVICRAFAELADFVAACRHLVASGGELLAMKGIFPRQEIDRLPPDVEVREGGALQVPFLEGERHLVRMGLGPA